MIDAPPESAEKVIRCVRELSLDVKKILLTHSHWDHIAEVAILKREFQAPVYIHEEDSSNLEKPGSDGLPLMLPIPGVHADGFLSDEQVITVGSLEIKVIHTPGHSPGCVCFYIKNEGVLIAGDTLFRGTIGRLDLPTCCPDRMWPSLKKLSSLPPETKVFPGHGPTTTIGRESWLAKAQSIFGD